MREIKFRGQRTLTKQWVYGNLMIKREESPIPETTELYTQHYIVPISGLDYYEYEVDPSTIGQYTGLKDINGKEIYEGDIVMCVVFGYERHEFPVEIVYLNGRFVGHNSDELTEDIDIDDLVLIEVIGNIHDNPELLKGGGE